MSRKSKRLTRLPAASEKRFRRKLTGWQVRFACILASEPGVLSKQTQSEIATRLANGERSEIAPDAPPVTVTYEMIRTLKARPDFQELVRKLEEGGPLEEARALLVNDMPLYMELHRWAAERARAKDDVRAMASLTVPVIDRVAPKRPDVALLQSQVIRIELTAEQLAGLDEPAIEVVSERIDTPASEPAKQLPRTVRTEDLYRNRTTFP